MYGPEISTFNAFTCLAPAHYEYVTMRLCKRVTRPVLQSKKPTDITVRTKSDTTLNCSALEPSHNQISSNVFCISGENGLS